MARSIRRQLRLLQVYATTTLLIAMAVGVAAFRQPRSATTFGEITAERINIVDANGTLRLVISNKDRMHPGVIGGRVLQRPRPYAGFLFFNDQGDEAGGMTLTGRADNGRRAADASLMFDQLGQDQTIGFAYSEENGQRTAAFQVWDRPETPLSDLVEQLNAANAIADRAASVALADAQGRNRLTLTVDPDGAASIQFLDADGRVVQRIAPPR
jgi:catechol 2,3-dioxygenase-like lactoylglutathione lyase family enzyme